MRMNTFELKVIAIDKTFFTGKCQQVIVSATDGSIGIMAHHENTVMALATRRLLTTVLQFLWISQRNLKKSMKEEPKKLWNEHRKLCVRNRASRNIICHRRIWLVLWQDWQQKSIIPRTNRNNRQKKVGISDLFSFRECI